MLKVENLENLWKKTQMHGFLFLQEDKREEPKRRQKWFWNELTKKGGGINISWIHHGMSFADNE